MHHFVLAKLVTSSIRIKSLIIMLYRLSMRESELSLNESKVSDLGSLLSKAHEEKQAMLQQHQEQFSRDRQVRVQGLALMEATFIQSTRTQKILITIQTLSCWYSLESSH